MRTAHRKGILFEMNEDAAKADRFEEQLKSLNVGKYRVRREQREGNAPFTYDRTGDGSFHLFVYFEELDLERLAATVGGVAMAAADLGLGFFRHDEEVGCSGRHTPFGTLVVYDPRHAAHPQERSPTLQVAPALLRNFDIQVPKYMAACDPYLLDVTRSGSALSETFRGGGIETPVTRLVPEAFH